MDLGDLFDTYSRQARLQPALLALFPMFVTVAVWVPALYDFAAGLVGLAIACGAVVYLAHIARSLGRKAELRLNDSWGGKPTTLWMTHGDRNLDPQTKARYHALLSDRIDGWSAPSPDDEARDPGGAEASYDSAVRWLREATRDRKRYGLVFKENVSYGFRRNLYGLKPIGLSLALLCVAGNAGALWHAIFIAAAGAIPPVGVASLALSIATAAGWILVVRPSWVRDAADGYARALLAACDQIGADGTS